MRSRSLLAVFIAAASLVLSLTPFSAHAGTPRAAGQSISSAPVHGRSSAAAAVASVFWIQKSLTVQPPHKKAGKGKKGQKLFNQYGVRTGANQRASLTFPDTTELHINQRTDLVLRNPHLTQVKRGMVSEVVSPGTNHQVQTASAIASAIGTEFMVKASKKAKTDKGSKKSKKPKKKVFVVTTEVAVKEGVVDVRNALGDVVVHAGQETTVVQGKAPSAPVAIDANSLFAWTNTIPHPDTVPGKNVVLQDNGGHVIDYSSQSPDPAPKTANHAAPFSLFQQAVSGWPAKNINDGNPTTGWSTDHGKNTNQWVKLGFGDGAAYTVNAIVLDPGATQGHPASNDAKDFELWVSTAGTDDSRFSKVVSGTAAQSASLQIFTLPKPVLAQYIKLVVLNNYGGDAIDVAEMEVVSQSQPVVIPTPTATATPVATSTPLPTATPPPALHTWSFDVVVGTTDYDSGDTPNVPTTEEIYKYETKGTTCGPAADTQPWHMTQSETTNDDGRNLSAANTTMNYDLTLVPGKAVSAPGGYFATTFTLSTSPDVGIVIDVSSPNYNPPDINGQLIIHETDGCTPQAAALARRVALASHPVSQYQAATQALTRVYSREYVPVQRAMVKRAALRRLEHSLVRQMHQGHNVAARLRHVENEISSLDVDIKEYGEFSRQIGHAVHRTQRQLNALLHKSMYGTWIKARD